MAQKQTNEFGFVPDEPQNDFGFIPDQVQTSQQLPQEQKPGLNVGGHGGIWGSLGADILAGAAEGGQSLHNLPYTATKLASQVGLVNSENVSSRPLTTPTNIDFAQYFGAKKSFPHKILREAVASAPYYTAGGLGLLGRTLGGATFGATQNLLNPALGAGIGGAASALVPEMGRAKELFNFMRPKKYIQQSIEDLGGSRNVDDIAKSLGSDIESNAKAFEKTYKQKLQPVEEAMTGKNIYETPNGTLERTYNPLDKKYKNLDLGGAEDAHQEFIENPTYENADALQKSLGEEARNVKPTKRSEFIEQKKLYKLRNSLKSDIHNSLNKYDPSKSLSDTYKDASDFYLKEYVPYKKVKTLMDVMGEKGATSDSLLNVFEKPKLTSDPEEISSALKVANDLGDVGKNKIMALKLAKIKNINPEKAISAYENVGTTGLNKYVTPTLDKVMKSLSKKVTAKKVAAWATGLGLAGIGGNELRKHLGGLL